MKPCVKIELPKGGNTQFSKQQACVCFHAAQEVGLRVSAVSHFVCTNAGQAKVIHNCFLHRFWTKEKTLNTRVGAAIWEGRQFWPAGPPAVTVGFTSHDGDKGAVCVAFSVSLPLQHNTLTDHFYSFSLHVYLSEKICEPHPYKECSSIYDHCR